MGVMVGVVVGSGRVVVWFVLASVVVRVVRLVRKSWWLTTRGSAAGLR